MSLAFADEVTRSKIHWPSMPSLACILDDPESWIEDQRCRKIVEAAKLVIHNNAPLTPTSISAVLKWDEWRRPDKFMWQHVGDAVTLPLADCDAELIIRDHGRAPLVKPDWSERTEDGS